MKWDIKLSQYDLIYRPMTNIKAQALAEFISSSTGETKPASRSVSRPSTNEDSSTHAEIGAGQPKDMSLLNLCWNRGRYMGRQITGKPEHDLFYSPKDDLLFEQSPRAHEMTMYESPGRSSHLQQKPLHADRFVFSRLHFNNNKSLYIQIIYLCQ